MNAKSALLLALITGAIYPLGFAPFGYFSVALLSVMGFFLLLVRAPHLAPWSALAFGFGKYLVGISWVYVSINQYGSAPPLLAGVLVLLFVCCCLREPISRFRASRPETWKWVCANSNKETVWAPRTSPETPSQTRRQSRRHPGRQRHSERACLGVGGRPGRSRRRQTAPKRPQTACLEPPEPEISNVTKNVG